MPPKTRRIAVMGYTSVGKSSLCIQFVESRFVDSYDPTIENTFSKSVKVRGQEYNLELIDTAGQDEFSLFSPQYSMDIHGYVLVYSITSMKSFEVVQIIYDKIVDVGKLNVPIVLVGNKTDLQIERVVSAEEGRRTADTWKAVFLETTAKQHEPVNDIFSKRNLNAKITVLVTGNGQLTRHSITAQNTPPKKPALDSKQIYQRRLTVIAFVYNST